MLAISKDAFGEANVTLLLVKCIVYISQGEESRAKEVLDMLSVNKEFGLDLIPLVIQRCQAAKMKSLEQEALALFARKGLTAVKEEGLISYDFPTIVRTVIKLQVDQAEGRGGFNIDSISSFKKYTILALDVIDKAVKKNKEDDQSADIATWLVKIFYDIASNDKHAIDPSARLDMSMTTIQMLACRKEFGKEMDQECCNVELWAHVNMLTWHIETARSSRMAEMDEEEKINQLAISWSTVQYLAKFCLDLLKKAKNSISNATDAFKGMELPIIVCRSEAMTNLEMWEELKTFVKEDVVKSQPEALQAITHIVCTHHSSPHNIKEDLIKTILSTLWVQKDITRHGVETLAAWFQRFVEVIMESIHNTNLMPAYQEWERALVGLYNNVRQSDKMRRYWPVDSLQWMYGQSVSHLFLFFVS